jgi:hypothetical protein
MVVPGKIISLSGQSIGRALSRSRARWRRGPQDGGAGRRASAASWAASEIAGVAGANDAIGAIGRTAACGAAAAPARALAPERDRRFALALAVELELDERQPCDRELDEACAPAGELAQAPAGLPEAREPATGAEGASSASAARPMKD